MLTYKIIEKIAKIETEYDEIQVNYMQWGNNEAKYDIRKWSFDGIPLKGFTLKEEEIRELASDLSDFFNIKDCGNESIDDFTKKDETEIIDFRKFIVHGDILSCERKGHSLYPVRAAAYVYKDNVGVKEYEVQGYYCEDCKAYYISESEFNRLKRLGSIMCQVFSKESFEEYKSGNAFGDLREESLLHIIGYNVNQIDNLSAETRHKILEYAIESGLMTRNEIRNHLSSLIMRNEGRTNFDKALEKWKTDRDWVMGYSSTGKQLIGIKYMIK